MTHTPHTTGTRSTPVGAGQETIADNSTRRPTEPESRVATRLLLWSLAAGIVMSILWSYEFVDSTLGDNIANGLLGHDAKESAISGLGSGLLFAAVSGFAGSFTACNIAVAGSIGPMGHASSGVSVRSLLRPIACFVASATVVSGTYGFVGVLAAEHLPQLSTDSVGSIPVRILQASVVFGVIGAAMLFLGMAAAGRVPDPFARRPLARVVVLGALVGGFLIGRPFPLFNKMFHWAAEEGEPLVGSAAFVLQSLGNMTITIGLFIAVAALTRGALLRWMTAPARVARITSSLMIALGTFTVVYWCLRVPAMFGYGWFPVMPYN